MTQAERIVAAVLVLVNAVIVALTVGKAVDWSGAQITQVTVAANALAAFVLAGYFHLKPGTSKEPAAVGASFTALVVSVLYLLDGFDVTHFGKDTIIAIGGAVTAGVLVFATALTRSVVTAGTTPEV